MRYPGQWYMASTSPLKQTDRQAATDRMRDRGTSQRPQPPRDLYAQPASRSVYLTWKLPATRWEEIKGWRIYTPNESTLYSALSDRGTRQATIPVDSGATPPTVTFYVSSVNQLGVESAKVSVSGKATAEAGAPPQPTPLPGYNQEAAGGANTSSTPGYRGDINSGSSSGGRQGL